MNWHLFGTDRIRNLISLQHRPSAWCLLGAAPTTLTDADSILLDPHRTKPHLCWSAFASPADAHRSDSFLVHFQARRFFAQKLYRHQVQKFLARPAGTLRTLSNIFFAWPDPPPKAKPVQLWNVDNAAEDFLLVLRQERLSSINEGNRIAG
jgi:hypothetical protein